MKGLAVRALGRDRANAITGPFYDWKARRETREYLGTLPTHDLKINVGAGHHPLESWVNLDWKRMEGVQVVHDIRRGLPFRPCSAQAIFAEHVIEHLSRADGARLLAECHRVLQPRGVLRVSTPDLERFLRSYAGDRDFLDSLPPFPGIETASDQVNRTFHDHGHLWSYDEELLRLLLEGAGFDSIVQTGFGVSKHPAMNGIDHPDRASESLYVDAVRGGDKL